MMYGRLLLFYPLKAEAELYENNLMNMYKKLNKDENDTSVNSYEKKLFPMKIQKPNPLYIFSGNDEAVIENVEVPTGNIRSGISEVCGFMTKKMFDVESYFWFTDLQLHNIFKQL